MLSILEWGTLVDGKEFAWQENYTYRYTFEKVE